MNFRHIVPLHGPNIWSRYACLEVSVDLTDAPVFDAPGAAALHDRLIAAWPELAARLRPPSGNGHPHAGEPPALVTCLGAVAKALEELVEPSESFGLMIVAGDTPQHWTVVLEFDEEHLVREAFVVADQLVEQAIVEATTGTAALTVVAAHRRIRSMADQFCLGPSTRAIVRAAQAREIPVRRLNMGSFVQLGHGARQRRIHTAETDCTGAISEAIASDKELTKELLRSVGVPVPDGRMAESAADAWDAAEEIGGPVVVKPRDGNHGRGVFTALTTREQVEAAFGVAAREGDGVIVERFALGGEHRLLIVDGKLAAASRGDPALVTGDGLSTIRTLVDTQINTDPRRGDADECPLAVLRFDSVAKLLLTQQGHTPDSVPKFGERVIVQYNGNLSIDVTDEVHPEVAARAIDAVRMVGLDVAGLDIVVRDISRPLEEQGGVVVEVNAGPGLQMHVQPSEGKSRPVGAAIVTSLFPNDPAGQVPLLGVLDDRVEPSAAGAEQPLVHAIGHILTAGGVCGGWACRAGIFVAGRRLTRAPNDERQAVDLLLANNRVEAAALGVTSRAILERGLAYDSCRVAVAAPAGSDETDSTRRGSVLAVLARAISPEGWLVIPAADAAAAKQAGVDMGRVVLFDATAESPVLRAHSAAGGRVVSVRQQQIVGATDGQELVLVSLKSLSLDDSPKCQALLGDVLAAAAATWVKGLAPATIAAGLTAYRKVCSMQ